MPQKGHNAAQNARKSMSETIQLFKCFWRFILPRPPSNESLSTVTAIIHFLSNFLKRLLKLFKKAYTVKSLLFVILNTIAMQEAVILSGYRNTSESLEKLKMRKVVHSSLLTAGPGNGHETKGKEKKTKGKVLCCMFLFNFCP